MRVLVLSGGGSHGAFEAGVIKSLVSRGYRWDAIAGVSVGAINGAFLAQFPKDQQPQAADRLLRFWFDLKGNKSVYKDWFPFGLLHSFTKGSLFNTAPLRQLVRENLDQEQLLTSGVKFRCGSVCLEDGSYRFASEVDPNIHEWVMASSAFPVAFPPSKIDGKSWTDGGVRNVAPIMDVLDLLPDAIDVINASPMGAPGMMSEKDTHNALKVALRTLGLLTDEVAATDIDKVPEAVLPVIRQWSPPPGSPMPFGLDFNPKDVAAMVELGYIIGQRDP